VGTAETLGGFRQNVPGGAPVSARTSEFHRRMTGCRHWLSRRQPPADLQIGRRQ